MKLVGWRYWAGVGLLAGTYFGTARLGLMMDAVSGFATLVWPPTGISLVALLLLGYRLWPGIALGALLVNWSIGAPFFTACGVGMGNTLEALIGAYLVQRWGGSPFSLGRVQGMLALVLLAGLLSTLISATIGVTSLWLGGRILLSAFGATWIAWWMGDLLGNLVVAPLLLTWTSGSRPRISLRRFAEATVLAVALLAVGIIAFWGSSESIFIPPYLTFPLLTWAAMRFGPRRNCRS